MARVYSSALKNSSGVCTGTNAVVQAVGSSLYSLAWDVVSGTQARVIIGGVSGTDIGEDQQWFYDPAAPAPFVLFYNNAQNPLGGQKLVASYSSNGQNTPTTWYQIDPANSPTLVTQGYSNTFVYPDVLLSGSMDEALYGPPGLGVQSSCYTSGSDANEYGYSRILGYFAAPMQGNSPNGVAAGEAIRSISYDSHGERSFRPRFARDSHGFIPLYSSSPISRTWYTFAMYNPTQINNAGTGCNAYSRWNSSDQEFAFSTVWIMEE